MRRCAGYLMGSSFLAADTEIHTQTSLAVYRSLLRSNYIFHVDHSTQTRQHIKLTFHAHYHAGFLSTNSLISLVRTGGGGGGGGSHGSALVAILAAMFKFHKIAKIGKIGVGATRTLIIHILISHF